MPRTHNVAHSRIAQELQCQGAVLGAVPQVAINQNLLVGSCANILETFFQVSNLAVTQRILEKLGPFQPNRAWNATTAGAVLRGVFAGVLLAAPNVENHCCGASNSLGNVIG